MTNRWRCVVGAACMLFCSLALAGDMQSFRISQADYSAPEFIVYLEALNGDGSALTALAPSALTASYGNHALQATSTAAFANTGAGVAYVFVVDHSRSISPHNFEALRAAMDRMVQGAGTKDQFALIAFADHVDVASDFTADKKAARVALQGLHLNGNRSLLHLAITRAIDMCQRRDAGLPERRAIVVISDGKDEGSGLAVEDILEKARVVHVPLYTIGFSSLPSTERRQYLDVLHRMALLSGGAYLEPNASTLVPSVAKMEQAARQVFVAHFRCSDCVADGQSSRLEVRINSGGHVLADNMMLACIPSPSAPVQGPQRRGRRAWWWGGGGAVLLVLLMIAALIVVKRRSRKSETTAAFDDPTASNDPLPNVVLGPTVQMQMSDDPFAPTKLAQDEGKIALKLLIVHGERPGKSLEARMVRHHPEPGDRDQDEERAVIGRRPSCTLTLLGDESVSGEHCLLRWSRGRMTVQDLDSRNGTLLNGIAVQGRHPVESGDTLQLGQSQYRILFEEK